VCFYAREQSCGKAGGYQTQLDRVNANGLPCNSQTLFVLSHMITNSLFGILRAFIRFSLTRCVFSFAKVCLFAFQFSSRVKFSVWNFGVIKIETQSSRNLFNFHIRVPRESHAIKSHRLAPKMCAREFDKYCENLCFLLLFLPRENDMGR